jgi:GT2 family glycosyltransferase
MTAETSVTGRTGEISAIGKTGRTGEIGAVGKGVKGGKTGVIGISVVVCAYTEDRWVPIVEGCAAVTAQLRSDDELILVIDHNPALLARARAELPGVRIVASDGPPGLSGARNTGVATGRREIVAFLDDDAKPRDGWLEQIRASFADPSTTVVGTRVIPRWQGYRPPSWFPEEFGWVVGCSYRGQPTKRAAIRNPIGASMAMRRSAVVDVGGFSSAIGRVGTLPVGCEETEICIRMAQRRPGIRVILDPDAAVDHLVPRQRQSLRYFVRRCFHEGRSKRAVARLCGSGAALSAERDYVRRVLPAALGRGLSPAALTRDPREFVRAMAVIVGLGATTVGYAQAMVTRS